MLIYLQKCGSFTQISFCRKIQQKLKFQQKPEETSLQEELKSQLKIRVAIGSLAVSQFQVTTTPISCFEEEKEVLKRVKSLIKERSCDTRNVVRTKGNI